MIIGTAGHIDHGKTLLVGALSGVDTDRLKEEKTRGISIDLGFAYLPTPDGPTIGFVDVPGHEGFVHNMLAGAAGIDFVLLVVAADDGVMPQTVEHLAIVDILGIDRGIAIVTKADLVSADRLGEVKTEIANALAGTALADVELVTVSAATGEGVDALREKLFLAAKSFSARASGGCFRLAVDRSFTLDGVGTVVTGTVRLGDVSIGDHVVVSPSGRQARVRSIHAQNQSVEHGRAGDRCALNLAGEGISKDAVGRGDFILDPWLHAPSARIDAMFRLRPTETRPVRQWTPVRLHHGAVEVGARIVLLHRDPIQPGEEVPVQLVLERPIAATVGDRYVLRDTSAQRTMGGGYLLDLRAPSRRRGTPRRIGQLEAHALSDPGEALGALLDRWPGYVNLVDFARDRALTDDEFDSIIADTGIVRVSAPKVSLGLSANNWSKLKEDLASTLASFHADKPNQQGMDVERLRVALEPRLPAPAFMAVLRVLAREGEISLEGGRVRLATHSVSLAPQDEKLWHGIEPLIAGDTRFAPPRVRDLANELSANEANVRRVMKLAVQMNRITEVAQDHYFTKATIGEIAEAIGKLAAAGANGEFSAAELRDCLGIGRNLAIRILEFFDRQGVTSRHGDVRRVNPRRLERYRSLASEPAEAD